MRAPQHLCRIRLTGGRTSVWWYLKSGRAVHLTGPADLALLPDDEQIAALKEMGR